MSEHQPSKFITAMLRSCEFEKKDEKVCNSCGELKPITEFDIVGVGSDLRRNKCKTCQHKKENKRYLKIKAEKEFDKMFMPI